MTFSSRGQAAYDALLAALHTQAYAATSRARSAGPDALSPEAVAVYQTMVGAYIAWADAAGIDVLAEPQRAVNAFLADRCAGSRPWSAATHQRYARLLTRLHWAHGGGSLIVVEGPPEAPRPPAASLTEVEHEMRAGAPGWISRAQVDKLTAPLFQRLPTEVIHVLNKLPETGPDVPVPPVTADSWKLARDLVMLSLGLDIGVRFQEIRLLQQGSIEVDRAQAAVVIHRHETVRTAKHRTIAAGRTGHGPREVAMWRARILLKWWLATMPPALRGPERVLFPSTAKGGALTPSTAYRILARLGATAPDPSHWLFTGGIQSLRRAHIQMALSEGVPAAWLQSQLGLHRLASVQRYLEDAEDALEAAVATLEGSLSKPT